MNEVDGGYVSDDTASTVDIQSREEWEAQFRGPADDAVPSTTPAAVPPREALKLSQQEMYNYLIQRGEESRGTTGHVPRGVEETKQGPPDPHAQLSTTPAGELAFDRGNVNVISSGSTAATDDPEAERARMDKILAKRKGLKAYTEDRRQDLLDARTSASGKGRQEAFDEARRAIDVDDVPTVFPEGPIASDSALAVFSRPPVEAGDETARISDLTKSKRGGLKMLGDQSLQDRRERFADLGSRRRDKLRARRGLTRPTGFPTQPTGPPQDAFGVPAPRAPDTAPRPRDAFSMRAEASSTALDVEQRPTPAPTIGGAQSSAGSNAFGPPSAPDPMRDEILRHIAMMHAGDASAGPTPSWVGGMSTEALGDYYLHLLNKANNRVISDPKGAGTVCKRNDIMHFPIHQKGIKSGLPMGMGVYKSQRVGTNVLGPESLLAGTIYGSLMVDHSYLSSDKTSAGSKKLGESSFQFLPPTSSRSDGWMRMSGPVFKQSALQ